MGVKRENTLVIDFSVLPKRPEPSAVHKFMCSELKLNNDDIVNVQFHNLRNCVYVEMVDIDTARGYQNTNHLQHHVRCGENAYKIPVYVEDGATNVRVHDLPPRTSHSVIAEHLRQYGTVLSITREVWKYYFPGLYNGVRVVRMQLTKPIPSHVTINGDVTLVTYQNHPRPKKVRLQQSENGQQHTYTTNPMEAVEPNGTFILDAASFPSLEEIPMKTNVSQQKQTVEEGNDKSKQYSQAVGNNSEPDSIDEETVTIQTANKRRLSSERKENSPKRTTQKQSIRNPRSEDTMDESEKESDDPASYSPVLTRSKRKNQ